MRLALTFDDGPSEWTEPILDVLRDRDARGTFFVVGGRIDGREHVLRRIAAEGHKLGNHTFGHLRLPRLDESEIRRELGRTEEAVRGVLGSGCTVFRPPGLEHDDRAVPIAASLGLREVGADVVPEDWRSDVDAKTIVQRVLEGARPGAIVDLHDGFPPNRRTSRTDCAPTVAAVRVLVPELQEQGYELVTVSALSRARAS